LATGRPIGTDSGIASDTLSTPAGLLAVGVVAPFGSTAYSVDQIVVSVGPYMFHSVFARCLIAAARSGDRASPPHRACKPSPPFQPAARSSRHVAGVAWSIVTPC